MKYAFFTFIALAPQIALAAPSSDFDDVALNFYEIAFILIQILIGLAIVLFLYGIIRYITTTDQGARKDAINVIIYGIITLFVMISVWGLVNLLGKSLGLDPLNINPVSGTGINTDSRDPTDFIK